MFKLTLVLAIIAGLAFATPSRPTGDEYRAELVKAGLSTPAIDGILKISGDAYTEFSTKYGKCPNFQDSIETVTRLILNLEKFMKTETKEDQEKYMAYVEKKKEEFDN